MFEEKPLKGSEMDAGTVADGLFEAHLAMISSKIELIAAARSEAERVAAILALPSTNSDVYFIVSGDNNLFLATPPNGITAPVAVSARANWVATFTKSEAHSAADLFNAMRPRWDYFHPVHWRELYETHRERMVALAVALEDEV